MSQRLCEVYSCSTSQALEAVMHLSAIMHAPDEGDKVVLASSYDIAEVHYAIEIACRGLEAAEHASTIYARRVQKLYTLFASEGYIMGYAMGGAGCEPL